MKSRRIAKIVAFVITVMLLTLCLCGCASVDVKVDRNGTGSATLTIAKAEGITEEAIRQKFEEISKGVKDSSEDQERIKLKSIHQTDEAFIVKLSFKRINYVKGLGEFSYIKSADFVDEQNSVEKISKEFANGIYKPISNYGDNKYKFNNGTRPNKKVAFLPKDAISGETLDIDEFVAKDGMLAQNKNGMMFTFFIADFEAVESITFTFDGKIKAYGSVNAEIIDDNTIKITPVKQKGQHTYFENATSTEPKTDEKDISVFAGYVYFELGFNKALLIVICVSCLILAGLIALGFTTGAFKKALKSKKFKIIVKNYDLYLMLIPAIILLVLFCYMPMTGVIMAFKNFKVTDGIWGSEWTDMGGFKHFVDLFTKSNADFPKLVRNTVILAGLKFVFGFVCAIVLAVLFSYLKDGLFKKSVQTISYFPYFISWVVVSSIVYLFLATATGSPNDPSTFSDQGILNKLIIRLGGEPIQWYSSPQYWRTVLTFTAMWKTVGYSTIVYLAAITGINPSLYEAAAIDGAGRGKQLWHVTIPGLFPVLGIQIIFSLGNLVKDDFDQIYTLTNGSAALSETTEVIGTIVYKSVSNPNSYSAAAAMGLMQGLVALVLVLVSNKLVKKLGVDGVF